MITPNGPGGGGVTRHIIDLPCDRPAAFAAMDAAIVADIAKTRARLGRTVIWGLCGPQGSGKSFTAVRLVAHLAGLGLGAVIASLDDFYLTREAREGLARTVHPLLATRGVPGTHDLALLEATISHLMEAAPDQEVAIPAFDKTLDDRVSPDQWPLFRGRPDVIILEGWCVGARPQAPTALAVPANALERIEDPAGSWRTYVNQQLAGPYMPLFAKLDRRTLLSAPSFETVFGWRGEQEAKLDRSARGSRPPMTQAQLHRFIAHYERLTRWLLEDQPAELVVDLAADRTPWRLRLMPPAAGLLTE
ncbi:kinase [Novosphingobium sp.]|uniref:kinase n=1 Tax=Novosphingobium sp. TaxID=1874826 RepID=UPI003B52C43F